MSQEKSQQPEEDQLPGEMFLNHPIPMFICDRKTLAFLYVNNSALEKYGYTREEFLGLTLGDIHATEGSGKQFHRLKNGESMTMEVISHPFEVEGKKVVLVMAQDITGRKYGEEALKQSEASLKQYNELLTSLLENLTIGVFMVEAPSGKPLIANEAAMKLLGRGILPDASRKNLAEVYKARKQGHQGPYPMEEMPIVRGIYGESAHVDDMIVERPDGSEIHLEVFGSPIKNENGEIWASLASFYDITGRKQIEEALRESKLTAEQYLNIAAEVIVSLDREGNITHMNESGHHLLGYDTTELIGKNWLDTCIPEEERDEVRHFFEMLKNGETKGLETCENGVITKNGERKTILWHNTVLRGQDDKVVGTLSSGEDITPRMEMEKALRIALAKYKTLFECFPLGITISDEAGNILETNPTAEKLLAVPHDEHVQRSIDGAEWRIVRLDGTPMPPDEYASVRALKEKRSVENVEMGIIKPDHTTTWISVNAAPLPMEGHGVVITYSDITARKRSEDLLQTRMRLGQFAESHTLVEVLQQTLNEAEALTGSQIGFAHFLEADQKTLELQTWSTNTIRNMCTAKGKGQYYPVDKAGVWVDCVHARAPIIHNDYASLPHRKGTPEGHAPVIRELVVPVIRNDLIVAIFGIGNKPTNYTHEDMDAVLQLANLAWDIVQRKRVEELLKESEWRNRIVSELTTDYIFVVDVDPSGLLKLRWASDNMFRLTGRTIEDAATSDMWENIIHPDDRGRFFGFISKTISTAEAGDLECRTFHKHGEERWVRIFVRPQVGEGNNVTTIVGAIDDITGRKQAELALIESREFIQSINNNLVSGMVYQLLRLKDGSRKFTYLSDAVWHLYGITPQEGMKNSDLIYGRVHKDDIQRVWEEEEESHRTLSVFRTETRMINPDGSVRWSSFISNPKRLEDGTTCWNGVELDITERKQAEEALEAANAELKAALTREQQLAHTDTLTGVSNRRNLYELAAHELDIATRYNQPLSIILFDLDHFKNVNDTFGHLVGDQMLVQVTQAACAELRSADSIGRYGGEEFVILLPMTNAQQAFSLAERIRERVAQISVPTPLGDAVVTLSIGIVEMRHEAGRGEIVDDMIRRADQAMYEAKQGGRNRSVIFNK